MEKEWQEYLEEEYLKFEELKGQDKIVVKVIQNGKVSNYWLNEKSNVMQLLGLLYQKTILKSSNLRIRHSYDYSDKQKITFINSYENYDETKTITKYVFYNVPTSMGYLDTYKINNEILGKVEE